MTAIPWSERNGIRLVTLETADDDVATLTEETWNRHVLQRHPCMAEHYEKPVETLQAPDDVHEGRANRNALLFRKWYQGQKPIPGECGENPTLIVIVSRVTRAVTTAYFADFPEGKLGKLVWPRRR